LTLSYLQIQQVPNTQQTDTPLPKPIGYNPC